MRLTRRDREQAAEALNALLDVVERGEVSADSPQEKRMLRRIEGAAALLAVEAGPDG
jgi:hypothetical protein